MEYSKRKYNLNKTIWKAMSMDIYFYLQDKVNVLLDIDNPEREKYIKQFTAYYRLRRNKDTWIIPYFDIFAKALTDDKLDYKKYVDLIQQMCIHKGKHNTELSFTSKMLHTIAPDKFPILDSKVLKGLHLPNEYQSYSIIIEEYNTILSDDNWKPFLNGIRDLLVPCLTNKQTITDYKLLDIVFFTNN